MEDLKAAAAQMEGLVDYQKDSVVSRTIIKNEKGNITLFAFDKGQGLSEHTAPFDAFVYIIDGSAEININGEKIASIKGDSLIMPADRPHSLNAKDRFKMLLVMIKGTG